MGKVLKAMVAIAATSLILVGCTSGTSSKVDDSKEKKEVKKILWEQGGELEAQKGYDRNIGTAGILAGKSNGYIIVGGGANFPEEPASKGGTKVLYPDIYVLKAEDGRLKQVNHTTLDYEIGYGNSITTDEGIYYVGGSPNEKEADNVTLIKADDKGEITTEHIGDLPFTLADGISVKHDKFIYTGLGKQNGEASNKFYKFDTETGKTEELVAIPGEATRNQAVAQVLGDNIYVFSGGDKVAYTDGYKYDIKNNSWSKISDVKIGDEEISLLGANSVKLDEDRMLVIGGFNKKIYDNAVDKLGSLKDKELDDFKQAYFGADPAEFNWNRKVLIYDSKTNEWTSTGEIPFNAPCGEGLILEGDNIYSINGEVKPGTRTERIYSGTLIYK